MTSGEVVCILIALLVGALAGWGLSDILRRMKKG